MLGQEHNLRARIANYICGNDGHGHLSPEEFTAEIVKEKLIKSSYKDSKTGMQSFTNSQLLSALRVIELIVQENK